MNSIRLQTHNAANCAWLDKRCDFFWLVVDWHFRAPPHPPFPLLGVDSSMWSLVKIMKRRPRPDRDAGDSVKGMKDMLWLFPFLTLLLHYKHILLIQFTVWPIICPTVYRICRLNVSELNILKDVMGWNNHENLKVPVIFFIFGGFLFNREIMQYSIIINDLII